MNPENEQESDFKNGKDVVETNPMDVFFQAILGRWVVELGCDIP